MFLAVWEVFKRLAPLVALVLALALGWTLLQLGNASAANVKLGEELVKVNQDLSEYKEKYQGALDKGREDLQAKQDENDKLSAEWQTKFNLAEKGRLNEKKQFEVTLAASTSERDRLRNLSSGILAANSRNASKESCDPADFRRAVRTAETFRFLLQQSDEVSEVLGREAEGLASQVRGLQSSVTALSESATIRP